MKTMTILLAILFSLALSQCQALGLSKSDFLNTLIVPRETTVGYFVTLESKEREYSTQTLRKNMRDDAQNPLWFFLYADETRGKEAEKPEANFARAAELYEQISKQRELTSEEVVNWAECVEFLEGLQAGIKLAQSYERKISKNRQKIYQHLATSYGSSIIYVLLGVTEDPGKTTFKADFRAIIEAYDRWRRNGIAADVEKAKQTMNIARAYSDQAVKWPDFGPDDYVGQGNIETQFGFLDLALKLVVIVENKENRTDDEIDELAAELFKEFMKSGSGIFNGYNQKAYAEKAKTDPQIQAALIFFRILTVLHREDFDGRKAYSPETEKAIAKARDEYRQMTKSLRTRAYGYDGLVTLDNIERKVTKNTTSMANMALSYDCTATNSFVFIANAKMDEGDYQAVINMSRKKVDKDHSGQAYFMLICGYIGKKDIKSVNRVAEEVKEYYDHFASQFQVKIDIALATAAIIGGNYQAPADRLFEIAKDCGKTDPNRTTCLYNLAVALYMADQRDDVLDVLDALESSSKNKEIQLNCTLLRAQVYLDKQKK